MNKDLMVAAGLGHTVDLVEAGLCPFCGKTVDKGSFRDGLSLREFGISGLCQSCQDEAFGPSGDGICQWEEES